MYLIVLAVTAVCFVGIASAQTPGSPSPTPLPQTPVPPPTLPPCTKPPLDSANPLHIYYRCNDDPQPPPPSSSAQPSLEGARHISGAESLRRELPATAFLAGDDYPGFELQSAEADLRADGAFFAVVAYSTADRRAAITLQTWTRTGEFLIVAPGQSPVTLTRQTTIAGLPALMMVPTDAVFMRQGDRRFIWTTGDRIYSLLAQNFSGDDAPLLALAERLAKRYLSVPRAPATGNIASSGEADKPPFVRLAMPAGIALLILSGILAVVEAARTAQANVASSHVCAATKGLCRLHFKLRVPGTLIQSRWRLRMRRQQDSSRASQSRLAGPN